MAKKVLVLATSYLDDLTTHPKDEGKAKEMLDKLAAESDGEIEIDYRIDRNPEEALSADEFAGVTAVIADLEKWWSKYDGLATSKRVVTPCILAVTRRAYGFDMRESQGKPYYSKKYLDLKKRIIGSSS